MEYSIGALARLAKVSCRTLRHYEDVGLLIPSHRRASGYRSYGLEELDRLQQILLFREMDVPLKEIRRILDLPGFAQRRALEEHQRLLEGRIRRLKAIQKTVKNTLKELDEEENTMSDEDKFQGFEEAEAQYRDEAVAEYGASAVEASEQRMASWSDEKKAAVFAEGQTIAKELVEFLGGPVDAPGALALAKRQHEYVNQFWEASFPAFRDLGQSYGEDERFAAFYDAFAPGLGAFFAQVIACYVDAHT
ncbi:MAG: MerR family transcriptional regulator [Spirochaetales bacterium]|nr:MerR family transcriptional regulator [Spirochaetales bacterium]